MPRIIKNKYFYTILAFLAWMLLFDKHNIVSQVKLVNRLNSMEHQKEYYLAEIDKATREAEELNSDMESLEKFAREKYLMKRDNEDVYVIVREPRR